ncbi:MAG: electron transfer flavoprotein subunit beta/FixA family protein [Deltaproteobacteria bacterium]|nr:electron transfer flavoprotein subunit beta/FixA family protein [Deltaproteobacteria bacterium]
MKILVTVKRVEDPESKIKVKPDGSGIVTDGINYKVNPFDEIAVEEALRLKDAHGGEVVVLSVGGSETTAEIRSALAMGGDRGVLVKTAGIVGADVASRLIQKVVEEESPDLVLMGKQAVDDDQGQAGQRLAERLGWALATQASKRASLESDEEKAKKPGLEFDGSALKVTREVDGGLEDLSLSLPAVVTCDLRLNQPRYASLPGIMKAKKKELKEIDAGGLGVALDEPVKVLGLKPPPERAGGEIVPDVPTLVAKLKSEAKVL